MYKDKEKKTKNKNEELENDKYVILDLNKEENLDNIRIDKYLSNLNKLNISREKIKKGILSGSILLNLKKIKNSTLLKNTDYIYIEKEILKSEEDIKKEEQELKKDILKNKNILKEILIYEDNDIIIINKPKGLIVHKGSGTSDIILADILEYNYNNLPGEEGRKGIVHRLDKDTTGLMIIAKTENAMNKLIQDFKEKNIVKKYVCIVRGEITDDVFTIKLPISRDLKNRHKMCVSKERKRSNNKSKENMDKKWDDKIRDRTFNRKNTSNKSTYGIFRSSNNR